MATSHAHDEPAPPSVYSQATRVLLSTIPPDFSKAYKTLVETRVEQLQEEIRALRQAQNANSLICRLPSEILAEICICLRDLVNPDSQTWSSAEAWIACTQVCQHWRNVAIACPALWSKLDLATLELATLMLLRSRGAPLTIKIDTSHEDQGRYLAEILDSETVSRLRSLQVHASSSVLASARDFEDWTKKRFRAPLLENLLISTEHWSSHRPVFNFPTEGIPSLRSLTLRGQSLDWDRIFVGRTLTYLALTQEPASPRLTPVKLYTMLEQSPNIQELRLVKCLPPAPTSSFSPQPLSMKSLRKLVVEDRDSNLRQFLKLVQFPKARSVEIGRNESNLKFDDACRMLSAILEWLPHGPLPLETFRKPFSIKFRDPGDFHTSEFSSNDRADPAYLAMSLDDWGDAAIERTMLSIAKVMDCTTLDTLDISLDYAEVTPKSWRVFSTFPNLQHLLIGGSVHSLDTFLRYLKRSTDQGDATLTEDLPFPALSDLSLLVALKIVGPRDVASRIVQDLIDRFASRPALRRLRLVESSGHFRSEYAKLRQAMPTTAIECDDMGGCRDTDSSEGESESNSSEESEFDSS